MKETGLLMTSGNMRAILEDRKTQTRRIVATDLRQQTEDTYMRGFPPDPQNVRMMYDYAKCDAPPGSCSVSYRVRCLYGFIGDRLWVRETHAFNPALAASMLDGRPVARRHIAYRASGGKWLCSRWRPSIFMHRWACRLVLELLMVRVERLQDISVAAIAAEGVHKTEDWYWLGPDGYLYGHAHEAFRAFWDSINAACGLSWGANPWVWVLRFKRVEQPEGLPT